MKLSTVVGLMFFVFLSMHVVATDDLAPPLVVIDEDIQPQVTIRKGEEKTSYEYRVNGQLVMIEVKPEQGPPYYFVDTDGDGDLDYSEDDPRKGRSVNQWILFRW